MFSMANIDDIIFLHFFFFFHISNIVFVCVRDCIDRNQLEFIVNIVWELISIKGIVSIKVLTFQYPITFYTEKTHSDWIAPLLLACLLACSLFLF